MTTEKFLNKPEQASMIKNDFDGGVAADATLPVILAGDVAIGTTSLVYLAGSTSLDVVFRPFKRLNCHLNVLIVIGAYTNMNSGCHNHQIGMDYLYDDIFKMATSEVKLRYCL